MWVHVHVRAHIRTHTYSSFRKEAGVGGKESSPVSPQGIAKATSGVGVPCAAPAWRWGIQLAGIDEEDS